MSGKGILYAGATVHDANLGKITLQGSNSYTGGTIVSAGTLIADGASTNAFGTGSVQVVSANAAFGGSQAHLRIAAGATNANASTALLNLAGGNAPGAADDGYIDLDTGINDTVAGLMLGGTIMPAGTYGATGSGATNINDEFFTGSGIITNAAVGVPGDYNNNGVVDAADEVLWRKGGALANDFTPGNQASDYDFWRSRFGATTNPGSGSGLRNSAVPEPSTMVMVGFAVSILFVGGRRRFVPVS
jgi:autotransporter-associated beta strand protein